MFCFEGKCKLLWGMGHIKYDNVFSLDSALYMQQHGLVSVDVSIQDQGVYISSFVFVLNYHY